MSLALNLSLVPVIIHVAAGVWYMSSAAGNAVSDNCKYECMTTLDCPSDLSCFLATKNRRGCCLKVLRPNQTDCVIDEQCSRACSTSLCVAEEGGSRCVCTPGYHFLFGKCWRECPPFAAQLAPLDGTSAATQCLLNADRLTAELLLMPRWKRSANYC